MRRVVINADDLGYDPAVTRGIVESMRAGIVRSTTFMVNTPYTAEAALQVDGLSVGLHLNVARWHSLARPSFEFIEAKAGELTAAHVEHEALAQLDRLELLLKRPATHLDVHKHLHRLPNVLTGVIAAAKARRLPVRSPDAAIRASLKAAGVPTNDLMLGDADRDAYWTLEALEAQLRAMPADGFIELMCHPGYSPSQVHSGYGAQREIELATFTSPKAVQLLKTLGLTIDTWH
jgi:predicted glycoside hydrolase/deacetylase ChbG (UPF0249 family)